MLVYVFGVVAVFAVCALGAFGEASRETIERQIGSVNRR